MNFLLLFKAWGAIILIEALGFLLSGVTDYCFTQTTNILWILLTITSLGFALAFLFFKKIPTSYISNKESLFLIASSWLLAITWGTIPFFVFAPKIPWIDTLFECTSGFTTTGASTIIDVESLPHGLLFWRSFMQWVGGLGFITLFIVLFSFAKTSERNFFTQESSTQNQDLNFTKLKTGISRITWLYVGLTLISILGFYYCKIPWFDAICQTFGTISTSGFCIKNDNVGAYQNPNLEWAILLIMFLGSCNFFLILKCFSKERKFISENEELKVYVGIILIAWLLLFIFGFFNSKILQLDGIEAAFRWGRQSLFTIISCSSTSGYSLADYNQCLPGVQLMLMLLMLIGGCSGSTAGGLKIYRCLVGFKLMKLSIIKTFLPYRIWSIKVNQQGVNSETQTLFLSHFLVFGFILFFSLLILALLEPQLSIKSLISTCISCLTNTGLGFELGPNGTYSFFKKISKLFLSFLMLVGRFEFYTFLVLLMPSFWSAKK